MTDSWEASQEASKSLNVTLGSDFLEPSRKRTEAFPEAFAEASMNARLPLLGLLPSTVGDGWVSLAPSNLTYYCWRIFSSIHGGSAFFCRRFPYTIWHLQPPSVCDLICQVMLQQVRLSQHLPRVSFLCGAFWNNFSVTCSFPVAGLPILLSELRALVLVLVFFLSYFKIAILQKDTKI